MIFRSPSPTLLALVLVTSSAAALAGCDHVVPGAAADTPPPDDRPKVTLGAIERGPVERPIRAVGVVQAKQKSELAFKVGGIVRTVRVDEGAIVKKGQVLAVLDPTELSAGAEQARRALDKARRDAERAERLHREAVLPKADKENADTALALAQSSLAAASFNEQSTVLVAPDDGVIERRSIEPGEVVAPGRPVLRFIGKRRGYVVRVAVSDRDVLSIANGTAATITIDARPDLELPSVVTDVARTANPRTGTFEVELPLPADLPFEPKSGLSVKARIAHTERPATTIPIEALVEGDGRSAFVYAVEDGHARRHAVTVAFLYGERAALTSPLEGVDAVVVQGERDLVDGRAVAVSAGNAAK